MLLLLKCWSSAACNHNFNFWLRFGFQQADVEVEFAMGSLENAEPLDPIYTLNGEILCRQKGPVSLESWPFGLMVLAELNLEEYTSIFFRSFRPNVSCITHVF
jgi:hypothetical protein